MKKKPINSKMEILNLPDTKLPFVFHDGCLHIDTPTVFNWHEGIEIICCRDGKGVVTCNSVNYTLSKGDIVIIGSMVVHDVKAFEDSFNYFYLIIDKNFCIKNAIDNAKQQLTGIVQDKNILEYFEEIHQLYKSKDGLYELKIRILVLQILYLILTSPSNFASSDDESNHIEYVRKVLTYINENFTKKISLEDISKHIGINRFDTTRIFKKVTRTTVFEYLNFKRCTEARILIELGMPVTEAAWKCGFQNQSYFAKTYKKIFGTLPSHDHLKSK